MAEIELKKQIKMWEEHIKNQEIADDFYYSNGKRDNDLKALTNLKQQLAERKSNK